MSAIPSRIKRYPGGAEYRGETNSDDDRHGRGVHKFSNGDLYDGEWENDEMCGRGIFTYADGKVVEGTFPSVWETPN